MIFSHLQGESAAPRQSPTQTQHTEFTSLTGTIFTGVFEKFTREPQRFCFPNIICRKTTFVQTCRDPWASLSVFNFLSLLSKHWVPVLVSKSGITTCQTGSYQVVKRVCPSIPFIPVGRQKKSLILDTSAHAWYMPLTIQQISVACSLWSPAIIVSEHWQTSSAETFRPKKGSSSTSLDCLNSLQLYQEKC